MAGGMDQPPGQPRRRTRQQSSDGKNGVRAAEITGEIRALTGLRIVAAVWVVLFHFRPMLGDASPGFRDALAPVLDCGAQGVDLFFILSGFVLTWNYLDRMGRSWSVRANLHFLWLRLARVWPVYLVTLHLAAVWVIFTLHVGHVPSPEAGQLTAISYVRQILLVQLWFQPYFDGSSWDGPAWSISAEWLAYLLFGLLILVIFRMKHATRARGLMWLAFAASLPPVVLLLASGQFYTPWSWLPRIVTQFAAGALACAAVRRLRPTDRARRIAGYLSVLVGVAIVGILYLLHAHPLAGVEDSGGVVDVLFVPLVISLAIGVGSLPALLSTRLMVLAGRSRFASTWCTSWCIPPGDGPCNNTSLRCRISRGNGTSSVCSRSPWGCDLAVSLRRRTGPPMDAPDGRRQSRECEKRARGAGRQHALSNRRCAGRGFGPRGVTVEWGCSGSTRVHIGFLVRFP